MGDEPRDRTDTDVLLSAAETAIKRQGLTEILELFDDGQGYSVSQGDAAISQWSGARRIVDGYERIIGRLRKANQ